MSLVESNEPWLGKVPADWRRSRIRNVARLSPSYSGATPREDETCTVVPMEMLSEDGAIDGSIQLEMRDVQDGLTLFEEGDVLFAKITPCMENGKGALVSRLPTRYAFGSTEFHVLRPSCDIDGKFLYYATFNPVFRAYAAENMTGSAGQKRVSSRFLKDTRLFLPPFPEQAGIAEYLDASCKSLDLAISAKGRQIEILDAFQGSIIQGVVTYGIGEDVPLIPTGNAWIERVPTGWNLVCLKRVSDIQTGLTLGKVYDGPLIEHPYLRVANVQDGYLDLEEITTIEVPATVARRVQLQTDDVLMTEGGDLDKLGRGYLWSGQMQGCLHQNHIFAVRCFRHKLVPKFLAYLTSSRYGRDYFEATGKRTTNLASTSSKKVGHFPIPLPPLPEQEKLIEFLDERLEKLARLRQQIAKQVSVLLAYRKSLVHEYVTGMQRIGEPDARRAESHA